MKVLLLHNYYRTAAPSGENQVFDAERSILQQATNWEVIQCTRSNDDLENLNWQGMIGTALRTPWNKYGFRQVKDLIALHKPDVLHVHNVFPQFSPAVFHAAANTGTATVMTMHNYRIGCANGLALRNGKPCTKCLDQRSIMPALVHRCYRSSLVATTPIAASIFLHRALGTWSKNVDAFIALTDFQRDILVNGGLPPDRVHVKSNWTWGPSATLAWGERQPKAIFVGRLRTEKGIRVLVEAWKHLGKDAPHLEILGDGDEIGFLRQEISSNNLPISLFGRCTAEAVAERTRTARLMIVPSICFESFSLSVVEALSHGVPIVASRLGSLPSIIQDGQNGLLFNPGDAVDLANTVKRVWGDNTLLSTLGVNARADFDRLYAPAAHVRAIQNIYSAAIDRCHERNHNRV